MDLVGRYQALLDLTRRMSEACLQQDWDAMHPLEAERVRLLNELQGAAKPDTRQAPQIAALIREILALDQDMLERTQTWMDHARILLRLKPADGQVSG